MGRPAAPRLPRFFVERRPAAWVLLAGALAWGAWAWWDLPRRKDPEVRVGVAAVIAPWLGRPVAEIESQVAIPLERALAEDPAVAYLRTEIRPGVALIEAELSETLREPPERALDRLRERCRGAAGLPEGVGPIVFASDVGDAASMLIAVRGETDAMPEVAARVAETLARLPGVRRVERVPSTGDRLLLRIDPEELAALGLTELPVRPLLIERGLAGPGGIVEFRGELPALGYRDAEELLAAPVGLGPFGEPLLLGDLVELERDDGGGPRVWLAQRDGTSGWTRAPADVLAVHRHPEVRLERFRAAIDAELAGLRANLPPGGALVVLTDEARGVESKLGLFQWSLAEGAALVMLVAWAGFRGWRGAAVLGLSIPVTLALTFGLMHLFGVELQQVSIGALILALGLLVDDPVVAADAALRERERGLSAREAAWRGPVVLSRAILFATLANIVAYLPLVVVRGNVGRFLWSIPVVITVSLVASRFVSMSFVPFFASYLVAGARPRTTAPAAADRIEGAMRWIVLHRRAVLAASLLLLPVGVLALASLPTQFFPRDPSPLFYVDVLAPGEARARELALGTEAALRSEATSIATFLGRSAPRFWFSVAQDVPRPGRAQLLVEAVDEATVAAQVDAFRGAVPHPEDAAVDLRELEIGKPVGPPVQVRLSGPDGEVLRRFGGRAIDAFAAAGTLVSIRDDWGIGARAARGGGPLELPIGTIGEGGAALPVVVSVAAAPGAGGAPRARYGGEPTVTVAAFPVPGLLPSEAIAVARPALAALSRELPPGYRLEYGGELEEQARAFRQITRALALSVVLIAGVLALQFRSIGKPLLVFATIPFGLVGAFVSLWATRSPFGFMAFAGVASLIGVIVSHIIVLFDRIESLERQGVPLEPALVDAVRSRARPVLVTVAATVLALVPLLRRGGPLWEPLCYAQMGGLTLATLVTFALVPALYAVVALDLGLLPWRGARPER